MLWHVSFIFFRQYIFLFYHVRRKNYLNNDIASIIIQYIAPWTHIIIAQSLQYGCMSYHVRSIFIMYVLSELGNLTGCRPIYNFNPSQAILAQLLPMTIGVDHPYAE